MQCPVCSNTPLVMSERQGIEIDYCPQCRGVWLDRGELDKLIDRSASQTEIREGLDRQMSASRQHDSRDSRNYPQEQHSDHYKDDGYHRRKKKGFLGELFDFD